MRPILHFDVIRAPYLVYELIIDLLSLASLAPYLLYELIIDLVSLASLAPFVGGLQ